MQKSTKRLAIGRSIYPLSHDKNSPSLKGFAEWRQYIRDEVRKAERARTLSTGTIEVYVMPVEQLEALINMESLRLQAESILEGRRA